MGGEALPQDLLCHLVLRANPIAAVMWGESSLAWFAGGAIFHLTQAPLKFSLFF